MKILKDATIVEKSGKTYLFGTVVEDDRFEIGHRILTSEIVSIDMEDMKSTTKSGTVYKFENILTQNEFVNKLKETETDLSKLHYILNFIL